MNFEINLKNRDARREEVRAIAFAQKEWLRNKIEPNGEIKRLWPYQHTTSEVKVSPASNLRGSCG